MDKVEDVLNVGDEVHVKIIDIDDRGKVSLDRLDKPPAPEGAAPAARRATTAVPVPRAATRVPVAKAIAPLGVTTRAKS